MSFDNVSVSELKQLVSVEKVLNFYGALLSHKGEGRCLFPERHHHGDQNPSMYVFNGRVYCRTQQCFEKKGADQFALVGLIEGLPSFKDQKRRLMEIGGLRLHADQIASRSVIRRFQWRDAANRTAWHLRWNVGKKFTWAQDPDGKEPGRGDCQPTLYLLEQVKSALEVILCEGERDADTLNNWLGELGMPEVLASCTPNGAHDIKAEYLVSLKGKTVLVSGDHDEPGQKYLNGCAKLLHGQALVVRVLKIPDDLKDWTDWKDSGATAEEFKVLLDSAASWQLPSLADNSIPSYKTDPLHEREFRPISAPDFIGIEDGHDGITWVLEDYLPAGGLVVLAGKPKEGKTTLIYEAAVHIAQGRPFLGRAVTRGAVLLLALEEHPRDVRLRLQALGASQTDNLFVQCGAVEPTQTTLKQLSDFIKKHDIKLVVVDTLASFWQLSDENDAVAVTKAVKPLLALARETGACVLLIHHARKSDGSHGDEIRGSGALFALVDVALILKRHQIETHRVLNGISRYPDTPTDLVIELREDGYVALGDLTAISKRAKIDALNAAMTEQPEEAETIFKRAGIANRPGYRYLAAMVETGGVIKEGKGVKGSPYCYRKNPIPAPPQSYRHERESEANFSNPSTSLSPCKKEHSNIEVIDLVN